jgi:aerobic-type carbon monoxide dehydrogenase small subunit (CoxS/CutS family)
VRVADDLKIKVNGQISPVAASADTPLLYVLTNELKLWGPRFGCGLAQCGSCSVLADGVEIRSCVTPVGAVANKSLTTFEGLAAWYAEQKGLAQAPALHPLQQAFIDHDAFQCGYCTPGQICSAVGCIREGHAKSDAEIREWMSGNLCRCGAYPNIVAAVNEAAGKAV